jgi:hypothetical protein
MKEKVKVSEMGKNPYATCRGGRIEAPNRNQEEIRASVIRSSEDLRK